MKNFFFSFFLLLIGFSAVARANQVQYLTVVSPGTCMAYFSPTLIFTGGGGSGAAGYATANGPYGVATAVLTSVGSGYTSPPTVTLNTASCSGVSITASITPQPSNSPQGIPPFTAEYGNFTGGFQLNGSYGTVGQCPISTGSGTVWQTCGTGVSNPIGAVYQTNFFSGATFSQRLSACIAGLSSTYGGTCDGRQEASGTLSSTITIGTSNVHIILPCATMTTPDSIVVSAGVRNTVIEGCAYQGGSASSGTNGGSVWIYTGTGNAVQVGDPTYATDTVGFQMRGVQINTASAASSTKAFYFYRTQEITVSDSYVIGPGGATSQVGFTLDGTGNYAGGNFYNIHVNGFATAWYLTGHLSGSATGDYANASTFSKIHVDCPTSSNNPISGTVGIDVVGGDGNTWIGGDVEGCSTMFSLGADATDNTVVGLRNENSTTQYNAAAGSQYNSVVSGGTLFTGQVIDSGTHNSFWDAFHRSYNNLNGDLWRSQADSTITNHIYTGVGLGNVRGRQDEWITDVPSSPGNYQNAWLWGPGDGTSGQQLWSLEDLINSVQRFGVQENTTAGGSNQSYLNGAGGGSVCFQCSANSGTGGTVFGSGGASPTTVASIDTAGNFFLNGEIQFQDGGSTSFSQLANTTNFYLDDSVSTGGPIQRFTAYVNGGTNLNAVGGGAVTLNGGQGGGTGGAIVESGGSSPSNVFTITGAGSWSSASNGQVGTASGTGSLVIGNHLNQIAANDYSGQCTVSISEAACSVSFQHSWTTPNCHATPQATSGTASAILAVLASNPYVVVPGSGSAAVYMESDPSTAITFAVTCVGNPN